MRLDGFGLFVNDMGKMIRFYKQAHLADLLTGSFSCKFYSIDFLG